ncbi:hypothetical protein [Negadavirga shengliensis]|uniref:Ubiquitin-like domain-containing protein n=1 Tax=Negadavirga shengliensis TaxID=1389218 RepID=A0ABV9T6R4_9BACT
MEKEKKHENQKQNDNEITLLIVVPTRTEPWEATFPKTSKISEVISAVIQQFGFASNGQYELKLDSDPNIELEPQRPLVSFGIKDGDKLILIDFGQAV